MEDRRGLCSGVVGLWVGVVYVEGRGRGPGGVGPPTRAGPGRPTDPSRGTPCARRTRVARHRPVCGAVSGRGRRASRQTRRGTTPSRGPRPRFQSRILRGVRPWVLWVGPVSSAPSPPPRVEVVPDHRDVGEVTDEVHHDVSTTAPDSPQGTVVPEEAHKDTLGPPTQNPVLTFRVTTDTGTLDLPPRGPTCVSDVGSTVDSSGGLSTVRVLNPTTSPEGSSCPDVFVEVGVKT